MIVVTVLGSAQMVKDLHYHLCSRPHQALMRKNRWYAQWHSHPVYPRVHWAIFILYLFGVVTGVYLALSGILKPPTFAAAEVTFEMPYSGANATRSANFNASGYATSSVVVSATEVKLDKSPSWWDLNYNYQKQLTITNSTSSATLSAGTTVSINVDAQSLFNASKLRSDCNDLRVDYYSGGTHTELNRSVDYTSGATNCSDSTSTIIYFKTQADIAANASDSNYYLYYGYSSASAPTNTLSAFDVGTASATFVAPFNGDATAMASGSGTPTTATGAIRYSGSKSAIVTGGNDYIRNATRGGVAGLSAFTVEFWFKSNNFTSANNDHYMYGDQGATSFSIRCVGLCANHALQTDIVIGGTTYYFGTGNNALNDSSWNHIALTYDGTTLRWFINGVLINSTAASGTVGGTDAGYTVNASGGGGGAFIGGYYDEFIISNIARYISNFTSQTKPFVRDANTKLLLHFDENGQDPRGATGFIADDSGNGNNGTFYSSWAAATPAYVSGLVGIDGSSSLIASGVTQSQSYAGHQGVFIEEGTTNKITNPSFENSTYNLNWTADASISATDNTTAPYFKFGTHSAKLIDSTAAATFTTSINVGNANTHTLSAYVYDGTAGNVGGTVDGTIAKLIFNGSATTSAYTNSGGGWWRLSYSAAGTASAQLFGVEVEANKTIYLDGVQLEEKAYATTYADGSLGSSYAWTGTANNSTSTRTVAALAYPTTNNLQYQSGTISFWFKPDFSSGDTHSEGYSGMAYVQAGYGGGWGPGFTILTPVGLGSGGNGNIGNSIQTWIHATGQTVSQTVTLTKGKWYYVAFTWGGGTGTMYVNNSSTSGNFSPTDLDTSFYIGGTNYYAHNADSVISDLRLFNNPLSSSQITNLYYAGLASYSEGSESVARYPNSGTYTTSSLDLGPDVSSNYGPPSSWGATAFTTTSASNSGSITYETQTSEDNSSWSNWTGVSGASISSLPKRYLKIKATLNANGTQNQTPSLTGINIAYVPDNNPPTNPTTTSSHSQNGGTPLTSNNWYNYPAPYFSWSGAIDNQDGDSGVAGYYVYFGTNSNADPLTDGSYQAASTYTASSLVSGNTYYLLIKTKDVAGNRSSSTYQAFIYKYDADPPINPSYVTASPVGYSSTNSFSFIWPSGSDSLSGIKGYYYKTGATSGAYSSDQFTANTLVTDVPSYQNGVNFFYVRSVDIAGNTLDSYTKVNYYYNANAPSEPTNLIVTPASSSINSFAFSWEKPNNYQGKINKYYYSVNEKPTISNSSTTTGTSLVGGSYATRQGTNIFYVVAEDEAGNKNFDVYASVEFSATTNAPGIPTGILITDSSNRAANRYSLIIGWSTPTTGTADHYMVERSTDGVTFSQIATTTSKDFIDSGLDNSTTYYY
ncbi:MAG: LamG domain-containing protein, partial [Patescibacteria group bacterium]|nr:LamG domain-containing protein [Patescibacteria group bacterium]